jgi:hypothetical protein
LLIFDTGSSDLWVAAQACDSSACQSVSQYTPSSSSSFQYTGNDFDITYGSGRAAGLEGSDAVTVGGFTIQQQEFGVVNRTTANILTNPISGIMGFGWEAIAQTRATPFWEAVAESGAMSNPLMGFYLKRYRGDANAAAVESDGGEFALGEVDQSKISGDINYISFDSSAKDYWRIPMQAITVQGSQVSGVVSDKDGHE